jgi:hypothetical protein
LGETGSYPVEALAGELARLLQELLGRGHPVVATTLHNLALACDGAGQEERARWLWKEARANLPALTDLRDVADLRETGVGGLVDSPSPP